MSIIKEIFVKIKAMDFLSGKAKKAADEIQRIPKEKTVELKAKDGISSVVSGITDSLGSIGGSVLGSFAGMFAGGLAVGAVQELGKAVGEVVTQLVDLGTETQKSISRLGAMKNLVTDSTEAYRMFNDVGRNTNYDLGAVQEMGVQLVNIGYSARNAADMIQLCADTAAGLGKGQAEAEQMVQTISRMQATGEATSRQIVALQMAGMDLDKAFGSINMSAEEAMQAMDEGSLDAQTAIQALTDYMHEFDGSMAQSKNNVTDKWGDVTANIKTGCGEIMAAIFDAFNQSEIIQDLIDFTEDFVDFVRSDGCGAFSDLQAVAEVCLDVIDVGLKIILGAIKAIILSVAQMYAAFRNVGVKIANALAPILQPLSKIWGFVKSILTSLGQSVSETINTSWSGMYGQWTGGWGTADDDAQHENHFSKVKRSGKNGKKASGGGGASSGDRMAERIAQKIQEEYKKALEKVKEMSAEIAEKIAATNETKEQESLRKLEAERVKYYNRIDEYKRAMDAAQTEEEKAENYRKLEDLKAQWAEYEAARRKEISRHADTTTYEQEMQHIQNLADMQRISADQRLELENRVLETRRAQLETLLVDTQLNADRRAEIEKQLAGTISQLHQNAAYDVRQGWLQGLRDIANQQVNFADAAKTAFSSLESGLVDLVSGTKSAKEVFSNFFKDLLKQMIQIFIRTLLIKAVMQAIGVKTGNVSIGAGDISNISNLASSFTGGSLAATPVISVGSRAGGGSVSAKGTYLVGEHGPELLRLGNVSGMVYNNRQTQAMLDNKPVVNIEIVNNTDSKMKARQEESFAGGRWLKRVIIDTVNEAAYTNEGGMRDTIAGVRGV